MLNFYKLIQHYNTLFHLCLNNHHYSKAKRWNPLTLASGQIIACLWGSSNPFSPTPLLKNPLFRPALCCSITSPPSTPQTHLPNKQIAARRTVFRRKSTKKWRLYDLPSGASPIFTRSIFTIAEHSS